jgi:hypothetical protein
MLERIKMSFKYDSLNSEQRRYYVEGINLLLDLKTNPRFSHGTLIHKIKNCECGLQGAIDLIEQDQNNNDNYIVLKKAIDNVHNDLIKKIYW